MFCPKINSFCQYESCPEYLPLEQEDYCVDMLFKKLVLGILSNKEKQALGRVRQKNLKGSVRP